MTGPILQLEQQSSRQVRGLPKATQGSWSFLLHHGGPALGRLELGGRGGPMPHRRSKRDGDSSGVARGDTEGLAAATWGPGWGAGPPAPVTQAATVPRGCLGVLPQVPRPSGPAEGRHEAGDHSPTSLHVAPTVCRAPVGSGWAGRGQGRQHKKTNHRAVRGACDGV